MGANDNELLFISSYALRNVASLALLISIRFLLKGGH